MSIRNYRLLKELGKGAFGTVVLVSHAVTGVQYCVKKVDVRQMSASEQRHAAMESRILNKFDHPNSVKYKEQFVEGGMLYIVMEVAEDGDLDKRLRKQRGRLLPEALILQWFVQICRALQHVHAHPTTRGLMALSPGLFSAAKQPGSAWHLVSVDGATGNVTRVGELVEASGGGIDGGGGGGGGGARAEGAPAQFDPDFGGSVVHAFGGSTTTPDGAFTMTHVLRRSKSKAHVVVRVDTACPGGKCSFAASALQTGVNNEYRASMFLQTEAA